MYIFSTIGTLLYGILFGIIFEIPTIILVLLGIIILICGVLSTKISNRFIGLTQKGVDEKEMWNGLKKYMEDFSMIDDKTVPELVLWEKYLVYATAFGIADKVLKQLEVIYPQLMEDDFNTGEYLGLMYHSGLNNTLIHNLEHGLNSAYYGSVNANSLSNYSSSFDYSNSSSGGGFGGGFSGGGGFGGRRRRSEVDAK